MLVTEPEHGRLSESVYHESSYTTIDEAKILFGPVKPHAFPTNPEFQHLETVLSNGEIISTYRGQSK
jgi:hypothetical protein